MNKKEAIEQLESFISDCKEFESVNPTEKDVQALELGLAALKETAQEVPVQEQCDKFYIINILINNRSYYLFDLELSISKNISDSLIISSENFAFKLATVAENFYEKSLVKVKNVSLEEIFY